MTSETSFEPLEGGCRCGQARIRMASEPIITHACHCRLCQQDTGAPVRAVAMIETDRVKIVQGRLQPFQAVGGHLQMRCPDCGCTLWVHRGDLGDAVALVGLGVLDKGERLEPEAHYFTRSKHPWIALPAGVPAFETIGDPGKPGVRERVIAALAAKGAGAPAWAKAAPAD